MKQLTSQHNFPCYSNSTAAPSGFSNCCTKFSAFLFVCWLIFLAASTGFAQDTITGAFEGRVTSRSVEIPGADVKITNIATGVTYNQVTDSKGRFYQGLLSPGVYDIEVSAKGMQTKILRRELKISRQGEVVPVPVSLEPISAVNPAAAPTAEPADNIRVRINAVDARRDGSFNEKDLEILPLGGTTFTRSFDELALLLPGVAPPPQTIGEVAGPGVGPGVGSAGQFAANGLRSRANNFTVDGSDNNDEDIGVRRQGFLALIPQPIESVKEYQAITLLAPAQFGRNIGAQVNAVSKTGANRFNGTVYGFFNSDRLNAGNFFDTVGGNSSINLQTAAGQSVLLNGSPMTAQYNAGGKDSFTFGQAGATFGGAVIPNRTFYFFSGEYQKINASKEKSFAVPTIEERGVFGMGATGLYQNMLMPNSDPRLRLCQNVNSVEIFETCNTTAVSNGGSSVFSLFPFPNNPNGVYGANTYTRLLPAGGRGTILSGRIDHNLNPDGKLQTVAGRYNFTDDNRYIPAVNEALFSTVKAKTRTHNLSLFYNTQLKRNLFNQIRFSYGRSRLEFDEVRDTEFLVPSQKYPNTPFLLNARYIENTTRPSAAGVANNGSVTYSPYYGTQNRLVTIEHPELFSAPLGQVVLAGYSPLGADVYNFPQRRVNNTFQLADELTFRIRGHSLTFGADTRRTDLDSDLPRLSRPLLVINGAPRMSYFHTTPCQNGGRQHAGNYFCFPTANDPYPILRPTDLAALGVASSFTQTFNIDRPDSKAKLRYYQFNFYAQDTWRVSPFLSLSYGLRYEYNSPVHEVNNLIENTFNDARVRQFAPGLENFIDGRTNLYEPDKNNFAPRVGFAFAPEIFGNNRTTVFRAGYGIFYDQILGAVANQSRNVFPTFITVNLGGLVYDSTIVQPIVFNNPARRANPSSINILGTNLSQYLQELAITYPNAITATLPARNLQMPMAHHYSFSFEQQLSRYLTTSVAYIGTQGRNLLRFTTPNKGAGLTSVPVYIANGGVALGRGITLNTERPIGRPQGNTDIGAVNLFETSASSKYNALQADVRGQFKDNLSFQFAYTFSKVEDDVSDVFDLAGAYALPQDSFNLAAERAPANFDVRHRWSYNLTYSFPQFKGYGKFLRAVTDDLQIASIGSFHSGQPFTVNSIVDVNLDGNLTDRLNTVNGIEITGNRRQPLRLATNNPVSLLAPFGQNGAVGRNSFRAGNFLDLNLSIMKGFSFSESQRLKFRVDIFNFINRANFGVPVRLLEAPGFGNATTTVTPARRIQVSAKFDFE